MAKKHAAYGTGFAGAKLVCAAKADASTLSRRDKDALLDAVAFVLHRLNGQVYTGCDLNISPEDMAMLSTRSPYVLAALPNTEVCPNTTTAHGVVGAIEAAFEHDVRGKRFLVHGCGAVGSVVAAELRDAGARVMAIDLNPERAKIEGVEALSPSSNWWETECDAIVPCSTSYLIDAAMAAQLRTSVLIGATNLLFAQPAALETVVRREILFVSESVSSAGAVMGDSIEHFDRQAFVDAKPEEVYGFVRTTVAKTTDELLSIAAALELPPSSATVFSQLALRAAERGPVGKRFRSWAQAQHSQPDVAAAAAALFGDRDARLPLFADSAPRRPLFRGHALGSVTAACGHEEGAQPQPQPELLSVVGLMRQQQHASGAAAAAGTRGARGLSTGSASVGAGAAGSGHLAGAQGSGALGAQSGAAAPVRTAASRNLSSASAASTWSFADARSAAAARSSGNTADVVIAGAGIMGLNIAYQLKRRAPELSVLLLEKASSLGHGSSGYSTGFQRAYYSFDETMQLALDGMAAYKNWRAYTQLSTAQETFTETGALWMLGKCAAENEAMVKRLAQYAIRADVMDAESIRERFPLMSVEPYPVFDDEGNEQPQSLGPLSAVYEYGCGHVDPNACLADLLAVARREGVEVRLNAAVDGLLLSADGSRCEGVRTATGEAISAGCVVNATGPWFEKLMASAGVTMSTTAKATRIQVAHKAVPDEYLDLPFTADCFGPSGIYFMPRKQNRQLVFGSVDHRFESEIVEDPDRCNPALDPDVKQDFLNCLLHRLPGLSQSGEVSGFSSMCVSPSYRHMIQNSATEPKPCAVPRSCL